MGLELGLLLVPAVLLGGYWLWRSARPTDEERALRSTRPVNVADAAEGQVVKLWGCVRIPGAPLTSPLGGVPCAGYELWVEHRVPHRAGSRRNATLPWEDAGTRVGVTDFLVEDQTGVALVEASPDAIVMIGEDTRWRTVGEDRDRIFAILETEADPRLIRHHDLRYREWCLRDGMEVVVRGRVKGRVAIPGERSSYREEASGPRLVGSAQDPIVLSDRGDL